MLPDSEPPQRLAFLSVYDKRGLIGLARAFQKSDVGLVASGGTCDVLRAEGIPVTSVETFTGSPALFGGRVKTLHPSVHGGILMSDSDQDRDEARRHGVRPIDFVVVNLYPFKEISEKSSSLRECIPSIDIGGPTLIRAAAKNFDRVSILVDPDDYHVVVEALTRTNQSPEIDIRRQLASKAFTRTAEFDRLVSSRFCKNSDEDHREIPEEKRVDAPDATEVPRDTEAIVATTDSPLPARLKIDMPRITTLRYGENPHQRAAIYGPSDQFMINPGRPAPSYNNLVDAQVAKECVQAIISMATDMSEPGPKAACAIIKHSSPCGMSIATSQCEAYDLALASDPLSAFGGVVAVSSPVDSQLLSRILRTFTECIIAPSFTDDALEILSSRKSPRILDFRSTGSNESGNASGLQLTQFGNCMLAQTRDEPGNFSEARVVSRSPINNENEGSTRSDIAELQTHLGPAVWRDVWLSWTACRFVKSNAIVVVKNGQTIGIGGGQPSRIGACDLAIGQARKNFPSDPLLSATEGSVAASDAFFPFADGVRSLADAGVKFIIQPGGSKRDQEVTDYALERDVTMILTGRRHFRH